MKTSTHRWFGLVATVVVVASVAWGFVVVGSPDARRVERLDGRRIEDLRQIVREMQDLVHDKDGRRLKRPLFDSLEALHKAARRRNLHIVDPQSGVNYGFRIIDPQHYELCATFKTVRKAEQEVFWNHKTGRRCWIIDALDPP